MGHTGLGFCSFYHQQDIHTIFLTLTLCLRPMLVDFLAFNRCLSFCSSLLFACITRPSLLYSPANHSRKMFTSDVCILSYLSASSSSSSSPNCRDSVTLAAVIPMPHSNWENQHPTLTIFHWKKDKGLPNITRISRRSLSPSNQ